MTSQPTNLLTALRLWASRRPTVGAPELSKETRNTSRHRSNRWLSAVSQRLSTTRKEASRLRSLTVPAPSSPLSCHGPVSSYLLSRWNKASSMVVLSSTVMDTTATGASAPRGKTPGIRTSCQSEWILQMSTESKYLQGNLHHSVLSRSLGSTLKHLRPYEIGEVHPEEAILGSLSAQLPLQVWRPVWPVVWPRASPGEATPGVPQLQ